MSLALATVDESAAVETTDFDALSLDEMATQIAAARQSAEDHLAAAAVYAVRCGHLLLAAKRKCLRGDWLKWVEQTGMSRYQVSVYMRLAHYSDEIVANGGMASINAAKEIVAGLPKVPENTPRNEELRDMAKLLREEGLSYAAIGSELGFTAPAVHKWLNPEWKDGFNNRRRAKRARDRAARAALKRQERDRAMKKKGGSIAEAYSLIRKTAQELDRACSELTDPEQRAEVTAALSDLHSKVEDRIVRALGIE